MKNFLLIGLMSVALCGKAQVIFFESFSYANTTTSGTDDIGGVAWTSTCPYCDPLVTTDYFHVVSNRLQNRDTNGPAYWETGEIDITACTQGITISVTINESGTLEGLGATCAGGCANTDIVKLEVSYDGGASWNAYSDAVNGTVSTAAIACDCGTCGSPTTTYPVPWCGDTLFGPTIATDDFTSNTFSDCMSVGLSSTARLRITTMTWAGSEYMTVDNVQLECSSCALPVQLSEFTAERTDQSAILNWSTLSETDNKKFIIERSSDGVVFEKIGSVKGEGNSSIKREYSYSDTRPLNKPYAYYRIKQMDLNGEFKYSEVKVVEYTPFSIVYNGKGIELNFSANPNKNYTFNLFDASGKRLLHGPARNLDVINWTKAGFYMIEIPELEIREKLVIP